MSKNIQFVYNILGFRAVVLLMLSTIATFFESVGIVAFIPFIGAMLSKDLKIDGMEYFNSVFQDESVQFVTAVILGIFFVKSAASFAFYSVLAECKFILNKRLRSKFYREIAGQSLDRYKKNDKGVLVNIGSEQVLRILIFFESAVLLITNFISTVVYSVVALSISLHFGIMTIISGVVLISVYKGINKKINKNSVDRVDYSGDYSSRFTQFLSLFKVLKATNSAEPWLKDLDKRVNRLSTSEKKAVILNGIVSSTREPIAVIFVITAMMVSYFYFGSQVESLLISMVLYYRGLSSAMAFQGYKTAVLDSSGSIEKYISFLKNDEVNVSRFNKIKYIDSDRFSLEKVSVYSDGMPLLQDITFEFEKNSVTGIIGKSGAGKTTLVDVLSGVNCLFEGSYRAPSSCSIESNERLLDLGYVTQEPIVFDGEIIENITFGYDVDIKRVNKMVEDLALNSWIGSLKHGLNTKVGDSGGKISGGQKQRISMARELYRSPSVLVLDEVTSALDDESTRAIIDCIEALRGTITIIIITHERSLSEVCDNLVFLEEGKMTKYIDSQSKIDIKNLLDRVFGV